MDALLEGKTMRSNPLEPRRSMCDRCGEVVLVVKLAGRDVAVDLELVGEQPAGLYVGVAHDGYARALRLPTTLRHSGESLHRPHEVTCDGR